MVTKVANDPNTYWVIKDGLRKLKTTRPAEVEYILGSLESTGTA
jgi:hypothetical protein